MASSERGLYRFRFARAVAAFESTAQGAADGNVSRYHIGGDTSQISKRKTKPSETCSWRAEA
jgi:hypothetical protein